MLSQSYRPFFGPPGKPIVGYLLGLTANLGLHFITGGGELAALYRRSEASRRTFSYLGAVTNYAIMFPINITIFEYYSLLVSRRCLPNQ